MSLEKNLARLTERDNRLALLISLTDPSPLQFCETEKGEKNLQHQGIYYHDQRGAKEEAKRWFSSLKIENTQVLHVYGVGLGYAYEAAKKWLHQNERHRLVFLEDDAAVLYRLLETPLGSRIVKDPQVVLLHIRNFKQDGYLLNWLNWTFIMQPTKVSALKLYAEKRRKLYKEISHKILFDAYNKTLFVGEILEYGIPFYENFFQNLLDLPHSYFGNNLFGKFKDVPAIICGAGPSLKKNFDLLTTLSNRALIFAGGSSMNALTSRDFLPHFGGGVDPFPAQYTRLITNRAFGVPYFYRSRMHHQACQAIKGPKLYVTGSGGYNTSEWFDEQLGLKATEVEEGLNVVHFTIEMARNMGCNPIILVGLDLAYTDEEIYAPGIVPDVAIPEKEFNEPSWELRPILRKDIHGKKVHTLWKWIGESEWFSEFAAKNKNLTILNATEGGIGAKDIPNFTLREVAKKHLSKSYKLKARVNKEIEKNSLSHLKRAKVVKTIKRFRTSLETCIKIIEKLDTPLRSRTALLHEMELGEEPGYKYLLELFNIAYKATLSFEFQELQKLKGRAKENQEQALNRRLYAFLTKTAQVNIALIDTAIKA